MYIFPQIYFCLPEIFETNVSNRFLSTKSPLKFVFSRCEFTKVMLKSKGWCEMFVLKPSGIQRLYYILNDILLLILYNFLCVIIVDSENTYSN